MQERLDFLKKKLFASTQGEGGGAIKASIIPGRLAKRGIPPFSSMEEQGDLGFQKRFLSSERG